MQANRHKSAVYDKIRGTVRREKLFRRGERVLLGLSGGADSTALLLAMSRLAGEYRLKLRAAHVNYARRGRESGADQRLVRKLCRRLSIPLDVYGARHGEIERMEGEGFQERARELRLGFFRSLCREHGLKKVLLGHNADDQVEGLLLRLLRGCGPGGLAGLAYRRKLPGLVLLRPLLDCRREELLGYLEEEKMPFRIDSSNLGLDYRRNRIRNSLLPLLRREYNPRLDEAIHRLCGLVRDEDQYLGRVVGGLLAETKKRGYLRRGDLDGLHPALGRRLLREFIWRYRPGLELRLDQVEAARSLIAARGGGWKLALGGGSNLVCDAGRLRILPEGRGGGEGVGDYYIGSPGEHHLAGGVRLALEEEKVDRREIKRRADDPCCEFIDAAGVSWPLLVRARRPGDLFYPLGLSGRKKLKDFFIDLKLRAAERDGQLLLLNDGEIAWVIGRRIDGRFAVSAKTKRVLRLEVVMEKKIGKEKGRSKK